MVLNIGLSILSHWNITQNLDCHNLEVGSTQHLHGRNVDYFKLIMQQPRGVKGEKPPAGSEVEMFHL
jgi:hypothetical protein